MILEANHKMRIVAGTGHRPQDLFFKYDETHKDCIKYKLYISDYLEEHASQIDYVISGMSLGFDVWIAEIAQLQHLKVHAYIPFKDQDSVWPPHSKKRYQKILSKCDNVIITSEGDYSAAKMQIRNKRMIDSCTHVLAFWNPTKMFGGTYNCLQYAKKKDRPIHNIWMEDHQDTINF